MSADYKVVGRLKEIVYFPLKSCRGISVAEANCNVQGIDYDRHWLVLDNDGRVVTLVVRNELAFVVPTVSGNEIKVEAPGMEQLIIPLEIPGDDLEFVDFTVYTVAGNGVRVSKEADEWFSEYLKGPHSLVAFHPKCKPRRVRDQPTFGMMPHVRDTDWTAYSDVCPYLLTSQESLAALNKQCTEINCDMQCFRPNLVIEGCKEFEEDTWHWIRIGNTFFRGLHKTGRCPQINVDPLTGVMNKKQPLRTLKQFRLAPKEEQKLYKYSPLFGRYLAIEIPGIVRVGDIVYASNANSVGFTMV